MSEQMTTILVDGLRYVYGVDVDVALANRDAEITELKAQVAKWTELHKLHVSLPERSEDDAEMYRALDTIADLRAQLSESRQQIGNRYAEIARLLTQIAKLQAWQDAVPVDAINAWWQSPVNWTGYDHAQYDAWYKAVKSWLNGLKVND